MTKRDKIGFVLFIIALLIVVFTFEAFSQTPADTVLTGRNVQFIDLGNGIIQHEIGGVVNFQNSNGIWKREDNSIKIYADTTSFGNTMVVKDSRLWVEFPDSSNGFVIVGRRESNNLNSIIKQKFKGAAFYNRQTKEYQFIAPSTVAATDILLGGNTIIYENVYNGADLKYSKTDRYLKEELVLSSVLRANLTDPYPGDETWVVLVSEIDYGILSFENDEHSENVFSASFREDSTSYSVKRSGENRINIPLQYAYLAEDIETKYKMKTFSANKNGKNLMLSGIPLSLVSDTLTYSGELVFDPTWEDQPDGTDGKDTYLNEASPTTNYGSTTPISIETESGSGARHRPFIQFDLSSFPGGALFDSATVSLVAVTPTTNAEDSVYFNIVIQSWVEAEATWNVYSTGNSWGSAGGDLSSNVRQPVLIDGISDGDTLIIPATEVVDSILSSTSTNLGWALRLNSEASATYSQILFRSSDHGTAGDRPKLIIYYTENPLSNTNIDSTYKDFTVQVDTSLSTWTSPPDSFQILNGIDSSAISEWFQASSFGDSVSTSDTLTADLQYNYLSVGISSAETLYSPVGTISTKPFPAAYNLTFSNVTDIGATATWDSSNVEGVVPDSFQVVGQDSITIYSENTTDITVALVDTLTSGVVYSMRVKDFRIDFHTLEFQPDGTIGQDSDLDSDNPDLNNGNDVSFKLLSSNSDNHRGINKFTELDGSIPSGAVIMSALLSYTLLTTHPSTLDSMLHIHEIPEFWDEDQVTWNDRITSTAWSTVGGWDSVSTSYADRNLNGKSVGDTVIFDITALVSKWVGEDSSMVNNGLVVAYASEQIPSGARSFDFESSNSVTASNRPKLTVSYTHFDSSFSDTTSFRTVDEPTITTPIIIDKDYKSFTVSFDTVLFGQAAFDSFAILTDDSLLISDFNTGLSFSTHDTLSDSTSYTLMIGGFNDDTLRIVSETVTEFTNHLVLGNAPYSMGVVSRFYNGAILSAVDSSGAGTNRAIFNEVNGLFTADTIPLTSINPDTFLDTVYFDGLYDTLINIFSVVIDSVDTTYSSPDTLVFYSMTQQVTTLNSIATTETTATFVFGPDSNSNDIFYRVTDSSTNFNVFIDTLSDTSSTDTTWYLKTGFDTLTVNSGINEEHRMFVESRNSDSLSTGLALSDSVFTWAVVPSLDTVYVVNKDSIKLFMNSGLNPSYTYFAFEDSISGLFVDVGTMSFRSSSITVDSSWAWGTFEDWGGSSGVTINVSPNTRYVLRGYSKDGNKKDQN